MTFRARIRVATVGIVVMTVVALGILTRRASLAHSLPAGLERLADQARLLDRELQSSAETAGADVLALSRHPLTLRVAAAPSPASESSAELARVFVAELSAKPRYLQLRLLDRRGFEIVRVDRSTTGGDVHAVAPEALQDKSERPYFRAAMALPVGDVHVSAIEPNEEHGTVEVPYVPVLRAATPLPVDGQRGGVLVVNVDMRPTLERLRTDSASRSRIYLLSERGEYLIHPDTSLRFGLARGRTLRDDDPIAALMGAGAAGPVTRVLDGHAPGRVGVAAVTDRPAGGPSTTLVVAEPTSRLLAGAAELNRSLLILGSIVLIGAIILAGTLSESLTSPIRRMAHAVELFESEGIWMPPADTHGELARLSDTLDQMISSEREKSSALIEETRIRREAEVVLEREAERGRMLSAVVASSADGIYTHSLDGRITTWNPGAERLYGYAADEIVGSDVETLVPEESREDWDHLLESVRRGVPVRDLETVHVTSNGRRIDVSVTISPVRTPSGDVHGASVIARDVSARKALEERLRLTVEAAPSGMVMVDPDGIIILVNKETERLFGYTRAELMGKPVEILVPDAYRGEHPTLREGFAEEPARRAMGSGRDLYGMRKDGVEIPVEIGLNPIETPGGLCVLASVVDISERKRTQDELRRSNAELEQFAYVASHDLREPLRQISSYTELLARRYEGQLDERADKYIHYAVDGARRMQLLIDGLLRFSRVTSGARALAPVDADQLVRRIVRSELRLAIEEAEATVEVGELPTVVADEHQLSLVFQNLISNAVKFRKEDTAPSVHVSADRQGELWRFSVRDNGIGIAHEYQERVFEMFQRLHGVGTYPGSGIGLTLARKIVEGHGGTIWFESEENVGTTFQFTLPAGAP